MNDSDKSTIVSSLWDFVDPNHSNTSWFNTSNGPIGLEVNQNDKGAITAHVYEGVPAEHTHDAVSFHTDGTVAHYENHK